MLREAVLPLSIQVVGSLGFEQSGGRMRRVSADGGGRVYMLISNCCVCVISPVSCELAEVSQKLVCKYRPILSN